MTEGSLSSVIVSLESGARPKGGVSTDSGEIPSLGGEHIADDGGFNLSSIKRIPRPFFETLRSGRIRPLDILVVKDGATTGKTSIVREDFPFHEAAVNEHVFCVRVDRTVASPEYVCQFLRSPLGQASIKRDLRGATVGGISRGFVDKVLLPLPPLAEQQRVADLLDRADALRAKRRAAISELTQLTQAIFLDMFGDPIANPLGWPVERLGSLLSSERPLTYGILKPGEYVEGGVPMLRIQDIVNGEVSLSRLHRVTTELSNQYRRTRLTGGEIVISLVGSIGLVARVPLELRDANIHRNLGMVVPGPAVTAEYLYQLMRLPHFLRLVRVKGGIQSLLNLGDLADAPIMLPPIKLQQQLANFGAALDRSRIKLNASLRELEALRASMQYRAFRGEL